MFDERDVLLKAAERISEEGMWCRGSWYLLDDDLDMDTYRVWAAVDVGMMDQASALKESGLRVPECLAGAIASAAVMLTDNLKDARRLAFAATDLLWKSGIRTISFNDNEAADAHEVAKATREAAL